jgi:hypothetical protein
MANALDSFEIEITCEKCRRKIKKSIGWVKAHNDFT